MATHNLQNASVLIHDDAGAVVNKKEKAKVTLTSSSELEDDPKRQLSQDEIDDLCRYPQWLLKDEDPRFLSSFSESMSLLPEEDETASVIADEPIKEFSLMPLTFDDLPPFQHNSSQDPAPVSRSLTFSRKKVASTEGSASSGEKKTLASLVLLRTKFLCLMLVLVM